MQTSGRAKCRLILQLSVFPLIVALCVGCVPLPAHAEERRPLTFGGVTLAQLLPNTGTARASPLAGVLYQDSGVISGQAINAKGKPLPGYIVRLTRRIAAHGRELTETLRTTPVDDSGAYVFEGVVPGEYALELFNGEKVITRVAVVLAGGAMSQSDIRLEEPGPRISGWTIAGIVAGTFIGVALICSSVPGGCGP